MGKLDVPLENAVDRLRDSHVHYSQGPEYELWVRNFQSGVAARHFDRMLLYLAASVAIIAAAGYFARRPLRRGFSIASRFLKQPGTPMAASLPAAAPMPYPAWQAGYMNRAYQLSAWCYGALLTLLALPILLLLVILAGTIIFNFDAEGVQLGIARARGFATGFLGWGRLWFTLLLLSLAGFTAFKIYGRYSLPKPFRPRIRVVCTTIRVVTLTITALSVGTFLMAASNLSNDPVVQFAWQVLRDLIGL
jgi:hypothetical protein